MVLPAFFVKYFVLKKVSTIFRNNLENISDMLLEIFSSPIASGAQLFLLIVCILAGLGAGLSAMDFRKTNK